MFTTLCGKNYKTQAGMERNHPVNTSGCRTCWHLIRLHQVASEFLNGRETVDITRRQVTRLLLYPLLVNIQSYTRRSRKWFTIPGERPIHVTVWPNGAGVVSQGRSEAEQQEDQQARIHQDQQRICETVRGQWDRFTPEQQAAWQPVLEQFENNMAVR